MMEPGPLSGEHADEVREIVHQEIEALMPKTSDMDIKIYEDEETGAQASSPLYLKLMDDAIRRVVREEIASLAGLALRRTQDRDFTRSGERNLAMEVANEETAQFWGEVLAEYGKEE